MNVITYRANGRQKLWKHMLIKEKVKNGDINEGYALGLVYHYIDSDVAGNVVVEREEYPKQCSNHHKK